MPVHRLHAHLCGSRRRLPADRRRTGMRAYLPSYELVAGSNLDHLLAMLGDPAGGWQPFAGGTDLMVVLETGRLPAGKFVSLWGIEELRGIDVAADAITLGAL